MDGSLYIIHNLILANFYWHMNSTNRWWHCKKLWH